jgi:hypothetical protein
MTFPTNHSELSTLNTERESIRRSSTWPEMLRASLILVREHPEFMNVVGLKVISTHEFAANARIYATFTGREANTIRLGFRTHGVPTLQGLPSRLTDGLTNPRFWKLHVAQNNLFESNLRETLRFVRFPHRVRNSSQLSSPNDQNDQNDQNSDNDDMVVDPFSSLEDWDGNDTGFLD